MKTMICTLLVLFTTTPVFASGGNGTGNGGDGIYIKGKVYLLDLVEAGIEQSPYFDPELKADPKILATVQKHLFDPAFRSIHDLLSRKITELKQVAPGSASVLAEALGFYSWNFVSAELMDVKDEHTSIKKGDENSVQLAVRRERNIMINRDQWAKLDHANKVALVTHEVFYAFQKSEDGNKNINRSYHARVINGYLYKQNLNEGGATKLLEISTGQYDRYYGRDFQNYLLLDEIVNSHEMLQSGVDVYGAVRFIQRGYSKISVDFVKKSDEDQGSEYVMGKSYDLSQVSLRDACENFLSHARGLSENFSSVFSEVSIYKRGLRFEMDPNGFAHPVLFIDEKAFADIYDEQTFQLRKVLPHRVYYFDTGNTVTLTDKQRVDYCVNRFNPYLK